MSKPRIELTQELVHELLDYFPHTGELRWRRRERGWFTNDRYWCYWNERFAGKPALIQRGTSGHLIGTILDKSYLAHRVIWLWMTGRWPDPQVDHRNRKKWDNRWVNLREATQRDNNRNLSMPRNNTSGHVGIYPRRNGRWYAQIKGTHLGCFDTRDKAIAARKRAERKYGFSSGHGRIRIKRAA